MYYQIVRMYERGIKLDVKVVRTAERVKGDLQVQHDQHGHLERTTLKASLRDGMPLSDDLLPALYDVELEGMAPLGFVLRGVELVDGVMYRQAWHVQDLPGRVPWSVCPRSELDALI